MFILYLILSVCIFSFIHVIVEVRIIARFSFILSEKANNHQRGFRSIFQQRRKNLTRNRSRKQKGCCFLLVENFAWCRGLSLIFLLLEFLLKIVIRYTIFFYYLRPVMIVAASTGTRSPVVSRSSATLLPSCGRSGS